MPDQDFEEVAAPEDHSEIEEDAALHGVESDAPSGLEVEEELHAEDAWRALLGEGDELP